MSPGLLARIRRRVCPPRWRQTVIVAAVLTLLLPSAALAATATETFRDDFEPTGGYSVNDGTLSWSAAWAELGESNGPTSGRVRVVSSSRCVVGNCLRIGGDQQSIKNKGALRQANLSGATKATLTFSYRRRLLDDSGGSITVAVSNGGSGWTNLATYNLNGSDGSPVPQSFPITGSIGSATQIRFLGSDGSDDEVESYFYVDNVEISAEYPINTPPSFNQNLGNRSDAEGSTISMDAGATDPDPDTLTYSASGLPPGTSINPSTGLISGMITYTASGASPYAVMVTVDDGNSGTDADSFTWTVTDTNRAPQIDPVTNRTVAEGSLSSFTATADDPDGDTLTFSLQGAPSGATIGSSSGIFTWTPTEVQGPGSYTFDVKVTDNGTPMLADSDGITVTVGEVNRPPSLAGPANQAHGEGDPVSLPITAADPDTPANTLTYSATGLPPGVSINRVVGLISGTISDTASDGSPYSVTVTADDGKGGSDGDTFTWTITADSPEAPPPPDPNRQPTLGPIGSRTVDEESALTFTVTATDPDGDSLTYSLLAGSDPIPQGSTINPGTGLFTWTPSETHGPGTYRFQVNVTDNGSPKLSAKRGVTITVSEVNAAPELEDPGDQYSLHGETVSLSVVASDPDVPAQSVTFTATGLPPGLSIGSETGRIEGTVGTTASTTSPYSVTITASDDGVPALVASVDFRWTITTPTQPIAYSATHETLQGSPLPIMLTSSHPTGKPVDYTIATQPTSGNLAGTARNLVYTPGPTAVGADSFTFTVTDGTETSPPATVTILIRLPNQPPHANPDNYTTSQRHPLTAPAPGVLGNDSEPDGDPLTATLDSGPNHGTLTLYPDGGFTYTPDPRYTGTDSFIYTVADTAGSRTAATATITITAAAQPPVKADVVADITSLDRSTVTEITERPSLDRTFVLMARATTSSISIMGFPLILLGLLGGAMLTAGRVTLLPMLRRGDAATGTVRLYDADLQYGLITTDEPGPDVFFHRAAVRPKRGTNLAAGNRVEYRATTHAHRDEATTVYLLPTTGETTTP